MSNPGGPIAPPPSAGLPPETWRPALRLARTFVSPIQRFLRIEAASGLLLMGAALIALIWANSGWADSYAHLWHSEVGFSLGSFEFARPLHFWVNDVLMAVFFFVVGLEIRREMHEGELSDLKRAGLPLLAALGGMAAPAGVYLLITWGTAGQHGWGVPMATDIAFAVGVLTLLGPRVPGALRVLLLAVAVIDDIGAILVIAIFYSNGVVFAWFGLAAAGLAAVWVVQATGTRAIWPYMAPGLAVWIGLYNAGVHPTLAGVLLGLATPVKVWLGTDGLRDAKHRLESLLDSKGPPDHDELDAVERACREATSPSAYLQHRLHAVVAYVVMPLFALANAGVALGGASFSGDAGTVFWGVVAGLVVGKFVGVSLATWLGQKSGLVSLPRGVGVRGVSVVASVAGIGFTMSLFVAQLAFPPGPLLETAKLGILVGSGVAMIVGGVLGMLLLRKPAAHEQHADETAAEQSAEL